VLQGIHQYTSSDDGDNDDESEVTALSLHMPHAMKEFGPE
jgi:hypothetical protein